MAHARPTPTPKGLKKNPLGEPLAAALALLIGIPLVGLFAMAMVHGQERAREAPLEAMLGVEAYRDLRAGERDRFHYLAPSDPSQRLRAPDFTLRDRHGRDWKLSDHRGKTVIINFWSITCPPCLEEMPSIMELGRLVQHRDDIELVTISTDQGWSDVERLFARSGPDLPFTLLFDPDKSVTQGKFGTRLYPETWIIDADGVIQLRYDGPRDWSAPLVVELLDRYSRT